MGWINLLSNRKGGTDMSKKRVSKAITNKEDIDFLVNLTANDLLTTSFVMEMFGDFTGQDKPRFHPYDTVRMPAGCYQLSPTSKNKEPFDTTVGIWVFNKVFIEEDLNKLFGYINKEVDKKVLKYIDSEMGYAIMEDDFDVEGLSRYIMKQQFYMKFVSVLAPGFTDDLLVINKKIEKKKIELITKYRNELAAGDAEVMEKIEKELIKYAQDILADDPSSDIFNSGTEADWKNNFKNMFISRGANKDPDPDKGYNLIMSSYMDGIKKEEYAALANTLVAGPYSRAKKTEIGGYWEKLFLSALQHITLDDPGSDCGTKDTITITLDKDVLEDMMYSYVQEGNNLVEITRKNKDKYLGKTVKMRFSSMCKSKKNGCICNKCMGNMPYRLYTDSVNEKNIKNIGCATPQLASKIKLINMKAFHESLVTFTEMDPMKAFGFGKTTSS